MKKLFLLAGVGIGMGLMYYLDGDRGSQRQRVLRSKVKELWNQAQDKLDQTAQDLSDQADIMANEADARMRGGIGVDEGLNRRTYSRMGDTARQSGAEGIL